MQAHKRRILLSGLTILGMSLVAGLVVSFSQWDRGSPFDTSTWGEYGYNPVGRAIYPLILIFHVFSVHPSLNSGSPGAGLYRVQKRKALASLTDWFRGYGHAMGIVSDRAVDHGLT